MSLTRPTSQLPSAFRLVRQILSESNAVQGLTTKELVKEALKLYQSENPNAAPSQLQASSSTAAESSTKGKGKGKNVAATGKKDRGVNVIPEGHPFVSTSHLKSQILARLQSQSLLLKLPLRTSPSSSTSSSGSGKPSFVWRLNNPKQSNLSTPQWNYPAHWDSLISGEKTPGELYYEYNANKAARSEEEKQRGLDGGKVLRTEKEIWAWEGRVDGLTTNLERGHLNRRRRVGRPAKERRSSQGYESLLGGAEGEALEKQVV